MTVARREGEILTRYCVSPGCLPLRTQIARRMLTAGCALTPEQIVITSGCQEALTLALRATCRPGDTVVVESPTYFNILQLMETLGLRASGTADRPARRHLPCALAGRPSRSSCSRLPAAIQLQ